MHKNPIAAIATPSGVGGVGIVRISGVNLEELATQFLGVTPRPRYAHYFVLRDAKDDQIDQALLIYFQSPASFTGEDVIEIHCHGGPRITQAVLNRTLEVGRGYGMVAAGPGDFSLRAYLNGKIDLVQAEAIADLINAQSDAALRGATLSLQGAFSSQINRLVEQITQLRILVESTLDFPEEEIEFIEAANAKERLEKIISALDALLVTSRQGKILRDGIRIVLVGPPNAGKSSLLNQLLGEERAIVTPLAGTTRDRIIENITIDGVPIHLVDTAGLRSSDDVVEKIGISQTWDEIIRADVILFMHDVTQIKTEAFNNLEKEILGRSRKDAQLLVVINKVDLLGREQKEHLEKISESNAIFISAKTGEGINELKKAILSFVGLQGANLGGVFTARARHLLAIEKAREHLIKGQPHGFSGNRSLELFAEELRYAQNNLGEITGKLLPDDLLGRIFSEFCIGK
jgi:tRNA modification GTPase